MTVKQAISDWTLGLNIGVELESNVKIFLISGHP